MAVANISNSGIGGLKAKELSATIIDKNFADFSNTATGTVTINGIRYKFITFTGNGTLTVTKAGQADVLVVGGGGAGGRGNGENGNGGYWGSAGGGGGVFYGDVYFTVGSHSITVGAGGASTSAAGGSSSVSFPTTDQRQPAYAAAGGGGGGTGFSNYGGLPPYSSYGSQGNGHPSAGTTLNRTGSSVTYGVGQGSASGSAPANIGRAGGNVGPYTFTGIPGGSGVVIIRVKLP